MSTHRRYESPVGQVLYDSDDGCFSEQLGDGSYGKIYRVSDTRALKVFKLKLGEKAIECRDDEVKTLQKLKGAGGHAPVCRSTGICFEERSNGLISRELPAYEMDFVPGVTLEDAIEFKMFTGSGSSLDGKQALEVMEKVCEAVAACHSQTSGGRSVHRDLAPKNIMVDIDQILDKDNQPRAFVSKAVIVDWGQAPRDDLYHTPAKPGTPLYAAPELLRAQPTEKDGRGEALEFELPTVDVWSLGAIAYFVRTGKHPSLSDDPNDQTEKTLAEYADYREQHPISLPNCKDDNDERLNEFIRRCTENDYKKRPQDAGEARKHLEPVSPPSVTPPYPKPAPKPKPRKRVVAVLAALIAVAAAVVIANGLGLFEMLDAMVSGVTPRASVEEYSWEELAVISDEIAEAEDEDAALEVAKRYNLVNEDGTLDGTQTKSVTLTDGTETSVQIVGFAHDDKSDGSGKAGITFIFTDAISEMYMNSDHDGTGGWESSDMRSWLSSDGKALLPEELQDVIVAVDKLTNNVGVTEDVSSVTTTSDELWLFSYVELVGELDISDSSYNAVYNAEGSQYKLFDDCGVSRGNDSNDILAKFYQGYSCDWWKRSLSSATLDDIHFFGSVASDGSTNHGYAAGIPYAVVPGFCISGSTSASASEEDSEVWGPTDRETFTWSSPASYVTFNSITDNPTLGDERNFVRVREAGVGTYSDSVEIEDGKTYEIYIYCHNNASSSLNESGEGLAQNVTLSSEFPSQIDSDDFGIVSATISSTSSTPASVWDSAYLVNKTGKSLYLRYVHDSAVITNDGSASGSILDADSLFSESGAFLAYWSDYWGIIPGCNDYAGYVVYQVVAESVSGDTLDAL